MINRYNEKAFIKNTALPLEVDGEGTLTVAIAKELKEEDAIDVKAELQADLGKALRFTPMPRKDIQLTLRRYKAAKRRIQRGRKS